MSEMKREDGWYWAKLRKDWHPYPWCKGAWVVGGHLIKDALFSEIGPRILLPDEQPDPKTWTDNVDVSGNTHPFVHSSPSDEQPAPAAVERPAELDVEALRELCAEATPGPLEVGTYTIPANDLGREKFGQAWPGITFHVVQTLDAHPQLKDKLQLVSITTGPYTNPTSNVHMRLEDACFWVAARTALPTALDYIQALEAQVAELRARSLRTEER